MYRMEQKDCAFHLSNVKNQGRRTIKSPDVMKSSQMTIFICILYLQFSLYGHRQLKNQIIGK